MSDQNTKIEWTHRRLADGSTVKGYTWNGWQGCTKMSPACLNCYAERDMAKLHKTVVWGPAAAGGTRPKTSNENWRKPERWARDAVAAGVRPLVFTASIADIGEEYDGPIIDHKGNALLRDRKTMHVAPHPFLDGPGKPLPDGWHAVLSAKCKVDGLEMVTIADLRKDVFTLMGRTADGLDWLVLTKRPDVLAHEWVGLASAWREGCRWATLDPRNRGEERVAKLKAAIAYFDRTGLIPNVWAGTTIENQEWADRRLPHLSRIPTPRHFVSVEPQVGPVVLQGEAEGRSYNWLQPPLPAPKSLDECRGVHWVISGGESGPGARPAHPAWYRSLRDQCVRAVVPFHMKQWGEWLPVDEAPLSVVSAKPGTYDEFQVFPDGKPHLSVEDVQAVREGRFPLPVLNYRVGKKAAGRLLDGVEWHETPASIL